MWSFLLVVYSVLIPFFLFYFILFLFLFFGDGLVECSAFGFDFCKVVLICETEFLVVDWIFENVMIMCWLINVGIYQIRYFFFV